MQGAWDRFRGRRRLSDRLWAGRHRVVLSVLGLHLGAIVILAATQDRPPATIALAASPVIVLTAVAALARRHRPVATAAAVVALLATNPALFGLLLPLSGGLVLAHVHALAVVAVVTAYRDSALVAATVATLAAYDLVGTLSWPGLAGARPGFVGSGAEDAVLHLLFAAVAAGVTWGAWRLAAVLAEVDNYRNLALPEVPGIEVYGHFEWDLVTGRITRSLDHSRIIGAPGELVSDLDTFLAQHVHPDDRDALDADMHHAAATGAPFAREFRVVVAGGEVRWVHVRVQVARWSGGRPRVLAGTTQGITERRRSEEQLRHALSLLTATLESTADGILAVTAEGEITSYNQTFAAMWRMPPEILAQRRASVALEYAKPSVLNPEAFAARINEIWSHPTAHAHDVIELADGRVFERYSRPQLVDGRPVGRVWSFRDVTARRRLEADLAHQALHDSLTDLANQSLFRDRVQHALARVGQTGETVAVAFIDLDSFKTINDSLGHLAGDRVIVAVAERLRTCLGPTDTAARLGGDEFAILVEDCRDPEDALALAARVHRVMQPPLLVDERNLVVTASMGIAFSSPVATTADALLRNADVAMYRAKAKGRGRYEIFEPGMDRAARQRLDLEADLHAAVASGQFLVHYQPIVTVGTGELVGLEALLRWNHPRDGLRVPEQFLAIAEETGLIREIGQTVLTTACTQVKAWHDRYGPARPGFVAINLSASELADPELAERVTDVLGRTGLPAACLTIEITERSLLDPGVSHRLRALEELGVQLAIDDFGIGYSSLSYLQRFPVSLLKIDRSFLSALPGGTADDPSLPLAIVQLAHALNLRALAEGVETPEQLCRLAEWGCDLAQGFETGRPLEAAAIDDLLRPAPLQAAERATHEPVL